MKSMLKSMKSFHFIMLLHKWMTLVGAHFLVVDHWQPLREIKILENVNTVTSPFVWLVKRDIILLRDALLTDSIYFKNLYLLNKLKISKSETRNQRLFSILYILNIVPSLAQNVDNIIN